MLNCCINPSISKEYISNRWSFFWSNHFSSNIEIYLLKNNKLYNKKLRYLFTKIPFIRRFSNISGDFYCIIHNNFGISKTIINNTNILDIIKNKNDINIQNKTDNLYNNKVLEQIKIIKNNGKNYDFTDKLTNIDKSLNLTLGEFFNLNKIKYTKDDTIYIKSLDCNTFTESYITDNIQNYIDKPINELI
jgi:hypothetical protein